MNQVAVAPPAAIAPPAWPSRRYAWYVVAVLLITYAFAVVDRIAIGLLVEPIKADLGISDTQVGLLQGFAFALFYSLFGLPMGILVDRWRRVRLLSLSLAAWSIATISCGLASTFGMIFLGRIGVGAGEASVTPASSSIISDLFRPEQRARAFGVFMVGGSIGTAAAYVLGSAAIRNADRIRALTPLLSDLRDWQIVFFSIGLPGVLLSLLVLLTVREPLRRDRISASGRLSLGPTLALLRQNRRAYLCLMIGAVLNTLVVNAQIGWLPTLFIRVHGWKASDVGTTLGLLGLPCGVSSALSAGFVMSWLYKRGRIDAPIFAVLTQSLVWATFGTMTALAPSAALSLVAYACTSLVSIWASTAAVTGLSQITPNEMRGQVVALYMVMTGLVALTLGGLSVGLLSDHVFTAPCGVAPSLAVVYLSCGVVSAVLLLYGRAAFAVAAERARVWTGS